MTGETFGEDDQRGWSHRMITEDDHRGWPHWMITQDDQRGWSENRELEGAAPCFPWSPWLWQETLKRYRRQKCQKCQKWHILIAMGLVPPTREVEVMARRQILQRGKLASPYPLLILSLSPELVADCTAYKLFICSIFQTLYLTFGFTNYWKLDAFLCILTTNFDCEHGGNSSSQRIKRFFYLVSSDLFLKSK